jgi:hypothetical protein
MSSIYLCNNCKKTFSTQSNLNRHYKNKIPCDKKNKFICDVCLMKFKDNYSLTRHKNKKIPCISAIIKLENENFILKENNLKFINLINKNNNIVVKTNNINYVYLLQDRASIESNSDIYKIGRTNQDNLKRLSGYQKGSRFLLLIECDNCINCEKEILSLFKINYLQDKSFGNEYFKGDYKKMIIDIMNIVLKL